jgi:hypothetical protein
MFCWAQLNFFQARRSADNPARPAWTLAPEADKNVRAPMTRMMKSEQVSCTRDGSGLELLFARAAVLSEWRCTL